MERFAKTILDAQKIREESFNHKAVDKAEKSQKPGSIDFNKFYKKSMMFAADEASGKNGFDGQATMPIYLLNQYCWNDIQYWAKEVLNNKGG